MSNAMKVIINFIACGLISYLIIHSVVNYSSAINKYSNKWYDARCSISKSADSIYEAKIYYDALVNHTHIYGYLNRTIPFKNKLYYNSPCKILLDYTRKVIDVKFSYAHAANNYHYYNYDNKANNDSMMQIILFSFLLFALLMILCLIITELNTISMIKRPDIESPKISKHSKPSKEHTKHSKEHTDVKEHDLRKAGIFYPSEFQSSAMDQKSTEKQNNFIKERDISDYPPVYPTECIEKK